jgi:hypothetical protein
MGDGEFDPSSVVAPSPVPLTELDQARGDSTDRVGGAELNTLSVGIPEAFAENVDEGKCRSWSPPQIATKLGSGERLRLGGLDCDHVAGPRLGVREGKLAENISRTQEAQDHLVPLVIDKGGLHVPPKQDQDAIPGLALVHQVLPGAEPAQASEPQEIVAIGIRQQLDECRTLNRSRRGRAGLTHRDRPGIPHASRPPSVQRLDSPIGGFPELRIGPGTVPSTLGSGAGCPELDPATVQT